MVFDVLVVDAQNVLVVFALRQFVFLLPLRDYYFGPERHDVVGQDVLLQLLSDIGVLLQDVFPDPFSNEVARGFGHGHVDEGRSLVKCDPEPADDARVLVLYAKVPLLVDLIPDVYEALHYE